MEPVNRDVNRSRMLPNQPMFRRRRQRKARRTGEFTELAFEITAQLQSDPRKTRETMLWDVTAFAESCRLAVVGGADLFSAYLFVSRLGRGTVTEEDREAVWAFLKADPRVSGVEMGPLMDAWWPR